MTPSAQPLTVDLYFSFRSPYSYLIVPRLVVLQERYNFQIRLRPVLPLIIRDTTFFARVDPLLPRYIQKVDTKRLAEYLGLPFQWPRPDPVVVERGQKDGIPKRAKVQPWIYRLTYLAVLAEEEGKGLQFANKVSTLIFSTTNWHLGTALEEAVAKAGVNLPELDRVLGRPSERERLAKVVEKNLEELKMSGHWGVPTCIFDGEPFFGQDRVDLLVWRMRQKGLVERTNLGGSRL